MLTPLYDRIKALGGRVHNEHIIIGGWPVQILPAFNPLVEAAILNAPMQNFESIQVPVVSADFWLLLRYNWGAQRTINALML